MPSFDSLIRGGRVATTGDAVDCDPAVKGSRVAALGHDLGDAERRVDTEILPGG